MKVYLKNNKFIQIKAENANDRRFAYQIGRPYEIDGFIDAEISHETMRKLLANRSNITYFDEKIHDVYERLKEIERGKKQREEQRRREKEEADRKRIEESRRLRQEREKAEKQRQEFLTKELSKIDEANEIKKSFNNNPKDFRNRFSYSSFLLPHQVAGCEIAAIFDKYAFFYDTGTGKTVMSLELMTRVQEKNECKFLIICPKTIINTAWMADCDEFFPSFRLLPLSKNIKPDQYKRIYKKWNETDENYERLYYDDFTDGKLSDRIKFIQNALIPRASAYIINPESFNVDDFLGLGINGIIVDESAMLKNYSSLISEKVRAFASKMQYTYLLSGKPAPNRYEEYYSQMKIVDGIYLNRSFGVYSRTHDIAKDVNRKSFTLSKEDCIDLPPKSYIIREVTLNKEAKEKYNEMYFAWITDYKKDLEERKHVSVGHHLSALRKLRQIASGFIVDEYDKKSSGHRIHNEKEKELMNVLDELGDSQAIIWGQHHYEIETIEQLLIERGDVVVTAYGKTKDKDQSIEAFKSGKARYIIAHPRTLMFGATLTNCTYAIYYSTSYSHEEYYQSHDRIYRIGQDKPCTYIFIQAQDTIDEDMFDCIQFKKSESEFFEALLKHVGEKEYV